MKYQEIYFRDIDTRAQVPSQVTKFIDNTYFPPSGDPNRGEGGGFSLENKNHRTKKWMVPGVPTDAQWLRICQNLDKVQILL